MKVFIVILFSFFSTVSIAQRRDTVYIDANKKMILKSAQRFEDRSFVQINGNPYSGALENIDVKTIESFDILNAQSASAVFGKQAQNGAILIKTIDPRQQKYADERLQKLKKYLALFNENKPLIVVNRVVYRGGIDSFVATDITNIDVLQSEYAVTNFGPTAKYGAVIITTKQKMDVQKGIFVN